DNLPELASNLSLGMSGSVVGALAAKAMSTVCGYFGSFFAAGPKSSADDAADRMERGFSC
ncbi:MAG: hypothetical protein K0U12_02285, partial [Gammaproteobacteria bacterium]|nr:hypothetical protein [Gammaproteobacteria bacterium]